MALGSSWRPDGAPNPSYPFFRGCFGVDGRLLPLPVDKLEWLVPGRSGIRPGSSSKNASNLVTDSFCVGKAPCEVEGRWLVSKGPGAIVFIRSMKPRGFVGAGVAMLFELRCPLLSGCRGFSGIFIGSSTLAPPNEKKSLA